MLVMFNINYLEPLHNDLRTAAWASPHLVTARLMSLERNKRDTSGKLQK